MKNTSSKTSLKTFCNCEVDFPTHLGFVKMFILVQTSVFCLLEHNETAAENENNIEKEEVNKNHR